ncbi:MAG: ABC transporter permease, partial [bacterium]
MHVDFPQIKRAVRIAYGGGAMRYGDKVFSENIMLVEPEYLQMFTFPLEKGDKNALFDRSSIILSAEVAEKYFGNEPAVGKQVSIKFSGERIESFIVGGVAKEFPKKRSFDFNILMAYEKLFDLVSLQKSDENDWSKFTGATLIELTDSKDLPHIVQSMEKYRKLQNAANTNWPVEEFIFDNLLNLSLNSYKVSGDISEGDSPVERTTLFFIGLFLLLLACFNYINIALASAGARLKEIGVRKVIGSKKLQLVQQFLGENILICLIAMALGIAMAHFFFVPTWNSLFQDEVFAFVAQLTEGIRKLFAFIAVVALLISCMGLFGLVSLNIEKRRKEFSIRKVLGANIRHIMALVNRQFVVLLVVATIVAVPAGYFILDMLLDEVYTYRVP